MRTIMGTRRDVLAGIGAGAALLASGVGTVALAQDATQAAQGKVLKIGVLGVMRGPGRLLGAGQQVRRRDHGRDLQRAGRRRDRRRAVPGRDRQHRRPARSRSSPSPVRRACSDQGIRYIIGPNVDTTAAVIVPLLRTGNAVNIAYGFGRYLYAPPQRHSILGMIASYQASPIIYDYLKESKGIRSVSFVARREADSLNQRDENVIEARRQRAGGRLLLLHLRAGHARLPPGDGSGCWRAATRRRC